MDADTKPRSCMKQKRIKRILDRNRSPLLVLVGKLCVYTNVCNVYGKDLTFLRPPILDCRNSYAKKIIQAWNYGRYSIQPYPPPCWPTTLIIMSIMGVVAMVTVAQGYRKILQMCRIKSKSKKIVLQTSKDLDSKAGILKTFDSDSDVIIVDNSANCIVWKHKKNFLPESYKLLDASSSPLIDTAAGQGQAVGIGKLAISWKDDMGKTHNFVLNEVIHIPESPVNILGLSAFSKNLGDYETKGTRINSSGQDSILTWDDGKYTRTFSHCDAHMPTLPVNDGYSTYHRFCNFVEKLHPIKKQCYHVNKPLKLKDQILYDVGEEVVYQNVDHIEKGVIERITSKTNMNVPEYHVKFKDNRVVQSTADLA